MGQYKYYINRSQINDSSERLTKAYRMEQVDHIPIVQVSKKDLPYSIYKKVYCKEVMLEQQLTNISLTMKHKTDYCPYLAPWHGVACYAELFGVNIEWPENDWPWAIPLITDNPMDVYKLKPKKLLESELWKKILETIDFFQRNVNGEIPVCTTDPQGPMATASLIWRTEDLMVACYTNPKEVHYLLDIITDVFIDFYEKQLQRIENPAFPGWGFPLGETGCGISISDDNAAFMSPELYEEFCVPYNSRISEHFNGLYLHSCGNWVHNIKPALKISKLRAINYHSAPRECDPAMARSLVKDKCSIWTGPTGNEVGFGGNKPGDIELYRDYVIPGNMGGDKKGLIITGLGDYPGKDDIVTPEEMDNFYDWLVKISEENVNHNYYKK